MGTNISKPGSGKALFFSTTAFAVSFAVWGLLAALAPTFTQLYNLTATQKSVMIAIPVLLGSVGRLFAGMTITRSVSGRIFPRQLCANATKKR